MMAVVLGLDAFSVAVSIGVYSCRPADVARTSFAFGFFQFIMPIIGYFLGSNVVQYIRQYDHWVAFGILMAVGIKMVADSFKKDDKDDSIDCKLLTIPTLFILAVATSIDALAVGITLGIAGANILFCSVIIGITAALMTMGGMYLGRGFSRLFNFKMEIVGGIALILLSLKMLTI